MIDLIVSTYIGLSSLLLPRILLSSKDTFGLSPEELGLILELTWMDQGIEITHNLTRNTQSPDQPDMKKLEIRPWENISKLFVVVFRPSSCFSVFSTMVTFCLGYAMLYTYALHIRQNISTEHCSRQLQLRAIWPPADSGSSSRCGKMASSSGNTAYVLRSNVLIQTLSTHCT